MLQKDSLLEWRTIYDNVLFGLEIRGNKYFAEVVNAYGITVNNRKQITKKDIVKIIDNKGKER